ncbi:hypothetical protein [Hymenobacter metallicola]|uniref:Uncharacterized protein n=1 Tax=Hymenobacter metallicola TaxID=2563114 RepID=A0A4Z0Q1D6_9BACT|nr:hypothetical protein [Hymenobacter metallicola]TGE22901.1 hypothetical protein E5K02_21295 [Hymenobacter metallicola]
MENLLYCIRLVLQVAPPLLWWTVGVLVFSLLNVELAWELWPHTPLAQPFFTGLAVGCVLLLPWIAVYLTWQLAEVVQSFFWKTIWRFASVAAFGGGLLFLFGALIFLWE